ncbi:hypothetical protein [Streptomyces sp. NPDC088135]|uniref:hypothetical protein n=1 Tax=unclassified Streptomyces TaxID=2593676 RepID=UPI00342407AE
MTEWRGTAARDTPPTLERIADEHQGAVHAAVLDLGEEVHPVLGTDGRVASRGPDAFVSSGGSAFAEPGRRLMTATA